MKLFIRNLKEARRIDSQTWQIQLQLSNFKSNVTKNHQTTLKFKFIQLNGIVEQIVPGNILIVNDGTGKVKLTNCQDSLFNRDKWLRKGAICSIFGYLKNEIGLPEVHVTELYPACVRLESWTNQVQDFQLFQMKLLEPEM